MPISATTRRLLLLALSFLLVWPSLSTTNNCNPEDKKVLLKIKKALNIQKDAWTADVQCCSWVGVFCDDTTHRVTDLAFLNNGVSGTGGIPDAIGDLPYLQTITFHKLNNISGPIPYSITKLKYLTSIDISWVNLTGSIPGFLGQLKNLTYLNLSFNNLTGPIPESLSQIPSLGYINLSRNRLTGTIPASLVSLKENPYLILSHNQLSGEVPRSFGEINFRTIDLSRNNLQGDITMLFGHNKTAYTLIFSRNMFEFDMSKVQVQQSVVEFDISHNKIYGSLPGAMAKLETIMSFNASYNRLCGQIPQGGRMQTWFDYSAYSHNRCLCGAPLNVTC